MYTNLDIPDLYGKIWYKECAEPIDMDDLYFKQGVQFYIYNPCSPLPDVNYITGEGEALWGVSYDDEF